MANRYYADEIVENVSSHDKVSSYPASLLTERYPMTPFKREHSSVSHFRKLLQNGNFALIGRFEFWGIRLKDRLIGCPYIPKDKCRNIRDFVNANGRILRASHLEISLTDIDFRIILSMYEWDSMKIRDLHSAKYHMLPLAFRQVVMEYYRIKTELKGCDEDSEDFQYYQKNKEKLNSTYGMCRRSREGHDAVRERRICQGRQTSVRTARQEQQKGVPVLSVGCMVHRMEP